MLRLRARQSLWAAGAAAETAAVVPNWSESHRAPSLTHPHMHHPLLAPPRCHNPTKAAATTTTKVFSTFAPPSLPRSSPSTPNYPTRRRDLVNWRARPLSLCRPTSLVSSLPRRYSASSPTMASEWTGIKVRQTFFDFFKERGHTIGMLRALCNLYLHPCSTPHAAFYPVIDIPSCSSGDVACL